MGQSVRDSLHPIAKTQIDILDAQGVTLELHHVCWLNDLCRKITDVPGGTLAKGRPFRAGNVWLWPITRQASLWYEWALESIDDSDMHSIFLAYALAHARDPGAFDKLYSLEDSMRAVIAWDKGLRQPFLRCLKP